MKTIYLLKPLGALPAGTAVSVLETREEPGAAKHYVDAIRAERLVAEGLASPNPPAPVAKPAAPRAPKEV